MVSTRKDKMKKEIILDKLSDKIAAMTVNDFSNLVDKHNLGIEDLDKIFYALRSILYLERKTK
jgi:hypothetical protein